MAGNPALVIRVAGTIEDLRRSLNEGKGEITAAGQQMIASTVALQGRLAIAEAAARQAGRAQLDLADDIAKAGKATEEQQKEMAQLSTRYLAMKGAVGTIKDEMRALTQETTAAAPPVNTLHASLGRFDGVLAAIGLHIGPEIRGLSELSDAAGKTAAQLGLLATAGLALGAGIGSYKLTRSILDFVGAAEGIDAAVSSAVASMMGWSDASERAGARADILARASKNAGHEITSVTEAIKINAKAAEDQALVFGKSANAAHDTMVAVSGWQKEIRTVRANGDFEQLTADMASQNFTLKELSTKYGVHVEALQYLARQTAAAAKVQADADAAAVKGQQAVAAAEREAESFRQARFKQQLDLEGKILDSTAKQTAAYLKLMNEGVLAELDAQARLNKVWGLDASGAIAHEVTAIETLEAKLRELQILQDQGQDTTKRVALAQQEFGDALMKAAVADDTARNARAKGNTELAKTPAVAASAGSSIDSLADTFNRAAGVVIGGLTGIASAQVPRNMRPGENPIETAAEFVSRTIRNGRDRGGPVEAGQPYYVGRGAQPELFVPSSAGTMYPAGSSGGSDSGPRIIQLVVDGRVLAQVVDEATMQRQREIGTRF